MYLAGILGLCALLCAPTLGRVSGCSELFALQDSPQQSSQPVTQDRPKPETPRTDPAKSDASQAGASDTQPPGSVPAKPPKQKSASKTKHKTPAKKTAAHSQAPQDSTKKVVKHGGTGEPTTQLTPGITEEQAARQRQTTAQLLSSTDATLQRIAVRQLSTDQKETIAQIRKFMQQAKAAEAEGDPQRSYKLALKAHLLTDDLDKP